MHALSNIVLRGRMGTWISAIALALMVSAESVAAREEWRDAQLYRDPVRSLLDRNSITRNGDRATVTRLRVVRIPPTDTFEYTLDVLEYGCADRSRILVKSETRAATGELIHERIAPTLPAALPDDEIALHRAVCSNAGWRNFAFFDRQSAIAHLLN
jgi:hypothetical protein